MKSTFVILTLFILASCRKPNNSSDDGLPPPTQDGLNVIACKVDGNPWIISPSMGSYTLAFNVIVRNDSICFGGLPSPPRFSQLIQAFYFFFYQKADTGKIYNLNDTTNAYVRLTTDSTCAGYTGRIGADLISANGSIRFTKYDTVNKIISGTFNCSFASPGCDSVRVTDGRFDLRYY